MHVTISKLCEERGQDAVTEEDGVDLMETKESGDVS
jgi:hypothetical protein